MKRSDLDALARALDRRLPDAVSREQRVAALTTYRVGGPIAVVARVVDEAGLRAVAEELGRTPAPVLVFGKGSNLLVSDRGFPGLGIVLVGTFEDLELDVPGGVARAGFRKRSKYRFKRSGSGEVMPRRM